MFFTRIVLSVFRPLRFITFHKTDTLPGSPRISNVFPHRFRNGIPLDIIKLSRLTIRIITRLMVSAPVRCGLRRRWKS